MALKPFLGKLLLIFFIAIFYSLLPLIPVAYRYLHTPDNTTYLGAEKYYPDYYLYLNFIGQGIKGNLLLQNDYSGEEIKPVPIHMEYLLLGKIGSIFNLSPQLIFHLSRFILNFIFVWCLFGFSGLFFKKFGNRLLSLLIALFYSGPYVSYFFSPPDFISRANFDQHHILGGIFTILTALFFLKTIDRENKKRFLINILLTSISLLFLSYFFTTGSLLLILVMLSVVAIPIIKPLVSQKTRLALCNSLPFTVPVLISVPLLFYIYFQFKNNIFLQNIGNYEAFFSATDSKEPFLKIVVYFLLFLLSIIIFFVLGLSKIRAEIKEHNPKLNSYLFVVSYIGFHFLFYIFFYHLLQISRMRLLRLPFMEFYGVIAVYGFGCLQNIIPKLKNSFCYLLLVVILFFFSAASLPQTISREFSYGLNPTDPNVFIPNNTYFNLMELNKYLDNKSQVLADENLSLIIPALLQKRVFFGHSVNTVNYNYKRDISLNILNEKMDSKTAAEYIKNFRITHIVSSFELNHYDFLKRIDKEGNLLLYQIAL